MGRGEAVYGVTVRDHMMIAHSFTGAVFGPAQRLHGATYVVDVTFRATDLDQDGVVVDIGLAAAQLHEVLDEFAFRNLDENASLPGNTTTEAMARVVADRIADRIAGGRLGENTGRLESLVVTLHESHIAWASYERAL